MNISNQEIKYDRQLPTVSFSIFPGETKEIDIQVEYVDTQYKIVINKSWFGKSIFDDADKTYSTTTQYTLYTKDINKVVNLVMSYTELKDKETVNIHFNLWTPVSGEEKEQEEMLFLTLHDLIYPKHKSYVKLRSSLTDVLRTSVEDQVKRMLNLCTDLYMTEYKHEKKERSL